LVKEELCRAEKSLLLAKRVALAYHRGLCFYAVPRLKELIMIDQHRMQARNLDSTTISLEGVGQ